MRLRPWVQTALACIAGAALLLAAVWLRYDLHQSDFEWLVERVLQLERRVNDIDHRDDRDDWKWTAAE